MDNDILTEFSIPENEIGAAVEVGDHGRLLISVEVIGRVDGKFIFRKHKKAEADGNFRPEGAKEIRERLLEKQGKDEPKD